MHFYILYTFYKGGYGVAVNKTPKNRLHIRKRKSRRNMSTQPYYIVTTTSGVLTLRGERSDTCPKRWPRA